MFGSDWPVCLLAASYAEVVAAAAPVLDGLTAAERAAVRGGTARAPLEGTGLEEHRLEHRLEEHRLEEHRAV